MGRSPRALTGQFSQVLPHLVDGLTPNGQMPPGDMLGGVMGMLKKLL